MIKYMAIPVRTPRLASNTVVADEEPTRVDLRLDGPQPRVVGAPEDVLRGVHARSESRTVR